MQNETSSIKVHFTYCTIILVLVIIAIATDRWTLQPKFTEFLSNAATMTSLVLGLVAIFYSFIANDGLSKSLGGISSVAEEIRASKEQIARQASLSEQTIRAADASAALATQAAKDMSSSFSSLSKTLVDIEQHTGSLHGSIGALPSRLDQLESRVIDATKTLGQKAEATKPAAPSKALDSTTVLDFLNRSTLSANLLAHACVLAKQSGQALSLAAFCEAIETKTENHMSGFLACMDAVQLIDTEPVEGKPRTYIVEEVHTALESSTRSYFEAFIERHYKDKKPEIFARWSSALQRLERLYGSASR